MDVSVQQEENLVAKKKPAAEEAAAALLNSVNGSDEPDAIESNIPPPPPRTPNQKRVKRVTEEIYNAPVEIEDADDDEDDDAIDAEVVPEKPKTPLEMLLEQLASDSHGLRVYVTRKEDSGATGLTFRNPCLVKRSVGSMEFRESFSLMMEIEFAVQRRWGGGEYYIEIRRSGAWVGAFTTVIEDPPLDQPQGHDAAGKFPPATYVPPAPQTFEAELDKFERMSAIIARASNRNAPAATPDAASMLDSTFGLVTKVMEITKPFMPEPAAVAPVKGMSALDAAVSLGTAFLGSQQGQNLLGAVTQRIMAPAARAPQQFAPPNGGSPLGQVSSQVPPPGLPAQPEMPPEMQREVAKQTAVNEFLGNVVVGLKHGEDQGFAIVMLTRACRVWPELIPELYPTLRQPPEATIAHLSMLAGEDLSAYPGAVEWIAVMQDDLLEHEIFQGVEVREPGAGQDSDALASNDGSGGGNPAEMGVSQEAIAAPVFTLQEGAGGQEPGARTTGAGNQGSGAGEETAAPDLEYYGGTDDDE